MQERGDLVDEVIASAIPYLPRVREQLLCPRGFGWVDDATWRVSAQA